MSNNNFLFDKWVAAWTEPTTRQALRNRIKQNKQNILDTKNNAITEEYYRFWLEVPNSNPLQRLVRHPLLLLQDKQKIDLLVKQQQMQQIKYAGIFASVTLGFYWILLSRRATFQKFFNNRERWVGWNIGRKVLGTYFTFLGWMITLNSHYEKKIPNTLNDKGMFKKYNIIFQEKFV